MSPPYRTGQIVNLILERAELKGIPIDPLKLQKLLFFSHGWWLARNGSPLINSNFQAWTYGPVVDEIYSQFRDVGSSYIGERRCMAWNGFQADVIKPDGPAEFIDHILDSYGSKSGIELSHLTHMAGTPWYEARSKYPGVRSVAISNEDIKKYFAQFLRQ